MAVTNPILATIEESAETALNNTLPPRLISADSHVTEPPHCYVDRIDPAFRDRAPKVVRDSDGGDVFVIDGMAAPVPLGIVAAAGKDPRDIKKSECRVEDLHRGGWDGMAAIYEVARQLKGNIDGDKAMAVLKGMKLSSPRGPISIDPDTRDIVQTVYVRELKKLGGVLYNVEFDKFDAVKDPGK